MIPFESSHYDRIKFIYVHQTLEWKSLKMILQPSNLTSRPIQFHYSSFRIHQVEIHLINEIDFKEKVNDPVKYVSFKKLLILFYSFSYSKKQNHKLDFLSLKDIHSYPFVQSERPSNPRTNNTSSINSRIEITSA